MPKVALTAPYLDLLPQPPPIVVDHLFHWDGWLRWWLTWPGPRRELSVSTEPSELVQLTNELREELERHPPNLKKIESINQRINDLEKRAPPEPNEKLMYDPRKGEKMEKAIHELPARRRDCVISVHWRHTKVPVIMRKLQFRDEQAFHMELTGAYRQLAGKLCD